MNLSAIPGGIYVAASTEKSEIFLLHPYNGYFFHPTVISLTFTAVTEDELSPNYMSQDFDLLSDAP